MNKLHLPNKKTPCLVLAKRLDKVWIENREFLQTETGLEADAQTLAAYIGLLKVMRDYDLKRVISFHGRVQRAKEFFRYCKDKNYP